MKIVWLIIIKQKRDFLQLTLNIEFLFYLRAHQFWWGCKGNLCRAYARPGGSSLPTVFNLTKIDELWEKKCVIYGCLQRNLWKILYIQFPLHKAENSCFISNFWTFSQLYTPNWSKKQNYKLAFQMHYKKIVFENFNIYFLNVLYVLSKKPKIPLVSYLFENVI